MIQISCVLLEDDALAKLEEFASQHGYTISNGNAPQYKILKKPGCFDALGVSKALYDISCFHSMNVAPGYWEVLPDEEIASNG